MSDVFVVDRAAFFGGAWPQGFIPLAEPDAEAFLAAACHRGRFTARSEAEATPAWKQWIPYCVLRCRSSAAAPDEGIRAGSDVTGIFQVQRTSGQGEARLHGSWSIGLGGHVEPVDRMASAETEQGANFFRRSLLRELSEELTLAIDLPEPRFVGLLNDDDTPVGRVHAGLVYTCDLVGDLPAARRQVTVREIRKMRGGFGSLVEFAELWQDRPRFESWSRFLIEAGVAGPMGDSAKLGAASGQKSGDPSHP